MRFIIIKKIKKKFHKEYFSPNGIPHSDRSFRSKKLRRRIVDSGMVSKEEEHTFNGPSLFRIQQTLFYIRFEGYEVLLYK